jgi:hypothetical protein
MLNQQKVDHWNRDNIFGLIMYCSSRKRAAARGPGGFHLDARAGKSYVFGAITFLGARPDAR